MEKMGKFFALTGILALGLSLFSCGGDSGSSSGFSYESKYDECASGSLPEITDSTVIKNKIVFLNGSEDVYYEYLKFTSETGGEYSIYKLEGEDLVQQNTFEGNSVPSSFVYDKDTGKVTVAFDAYIFKAGSYFGVAEGVCTPLSGDLSLGLFQEWNAGSFNVYFDEIGTCAFIPTGSIGGISFTNNKGWISANEVGFCWVKINNVNTLYYLAYQTERSTVDEPGRACSTNEINLVSSKFLFLK